MCIHHLLSHAQHFFVLPMELLKTKLASLWLAEQSCEVERVLNLAPSMLSLFSPIILQSFQAMKALLELWEPSRLLRVTRDQNLTYEQVAKLQ